MAESFDLVVVGGGVGGGALATVLARAGLSVLVLEKSTVYRDHVRGEWMAPWGVAELVSLGLYDEVRAAGGHHLAKHLACHEGVPHDEALAGAIDLTTLVPGVPGPLCIGHPALCQLLVDLVAASGATVRRGVSDVRISPGPAPSVEYRDEGGARSVRCRLIVGADGRGSQVRRQLGIELERDPTHHLFAGMLVEGAHGWPEDTQVLGAEGAPISSPSRRGTGGCGCTSATRRMSRGVSPARADRARFSTPSVPPACPAASTSPARSRPVHATPIRTRTAGRRISRARAWC